MSSLAPDKALIFRIVHVENLPWMVEHGLQCRNTPNPNQAEAMVHGDIPLESLRGIACHSGAVLERIRATISRRYPELSLKAIPSWYF